MGDEGDGAYSDEEYVELLGFLADQKLEVQRFAAEGVLAQTESQAFLDYCRRQPRKAAKPLLRLAEKAEADAATSEAAAAVAAEGKGAGADKAARQAAMEAAQASAAGSAALQALVNISAVPAVRDELVELSAPRRAIEAMRSGWLEGRSRLAHWYAMLLANVTTAKEGQEAVCADEAMLRFLLAAFAAKPRPPARDGYDDPLGFLGRTLGNACAVEAGRKALAGEGQSGVGTLVGELADRARRPDVMCALRNLCLDTGCHGAVVAADPLPSMARFLFPWEKAGPEARAALPEALGAALAAEGAALTGDGAVRHSAAICFLGLCRSAEGRTYLRAAGAPAVLGAWRAEEADEETQTALDSVAPALDEEEEAAAAAPPAVGEEAAAEEAAAGEPAAGEAAEEAAATR